MSGDTENDIPDKGERPAQAENIIDQREVDNHTNPTPDEMRIDAGKLFMQATEQTRMSLCVSDPFVDGNPIIYVNEAFVELTGYAREDILGNNCRFMQGEDTDPEAVAKIREALRKREVTVVDILNYKQDGTPFWNALHIGPIFDEQGKLSYFYGSQWDITEILTEREKTKQQQRVMEELRHRTGNLFGVVSAIVRLSARGETDAQVLADKITERIAALATAHRVSLAGDGTIAGKTDLLTLAREVVKPYQTSGSERIELVGDPVELPREMLTPIGLTLHEFATNALKYGSLGHPVGTVAINWERKDDELILRWVERGGLAKEEVETTGSGTGTRLIDGVIRGIGGRVESVIEPEGFQATVTVPVAEDDTSGDHSDASSEEPDAA